ALSRATSVAVGSAGGSRWRYLLSRGRSAESRGAGPYRHVALDRAACAFHRPGDLRGLRLQQHAPLSRGVRRTGQERVASSAVSNRVPATGSRRGWTWSARSRQLAASHRGDSTLHPRLQRLRGKYIDAPGALREDARIASEPGESRVALVGCKSCETIQGHGWCAGGGREVA